MVKYIFSIESPHFYITTSTVRKIRSRLEHKNDIEPKMSTLRRVVSLLILLIGCFWQLIFICRQYFAYNVTTHVMIEHSTIPPPEFSVCSADWFGYFQLPKTYFSPADIDRLTPTIDDVFKKLVFRNWTGNLGILFDTGNSADHELRSKFFHQQKSVKMESAKLYLCYSIKFLPKVEPFVKLQYRQGLWIVTMPRFNNSRVGFAFTLSGARHGFYGISHEELTMFVDDTTSMLRLLFDYTEINMLSAPYTSNCVNYEMVQSLNCNSRIECIDKCLESREIQDHRMHSALTIVSNMTSKLPIMTTAKFGAVARSRRLTRSRYSPCHSVFNRRDCKQSIYGNLKTLIERGREKLDQNGFKFIPTPNASPSMVVNFYPNVTTVEFVVFVMSTLSLWLTIDPSWLVAKITTFLLGHNRRSKQVKQRKKSKVQKWIRLSMITQELVAINSQDIKQMKVILKQIVQERY